MAVATVTSKGQTTIPIKVRQYLKLQPGDKLDFVIRENGEVVLKPVTRSILDLEGILARPGQKRLSTEEMDDAVRQRYARR